MLHSFRNVPALVDCDRRLENRAERLLRSENETAIDVRFGFAVTPDDVERVPYLEHVGAVARIEVHRTLEVGDRFFVSALTTLDRSLEQGGMRITWSRALYRVELRNRSRIVTLAVILVYAAREMNVGIVGVDRGRSLERGERKVQASRRSVDAGPVQFGVRDREKCPRHRKPRVPLGRSPQQSGCLAYWTGLKIGLEQLPGTGI